MGGNAVKLYGPLAALAAGLTTAISSVEIPDKSQLGGAAPYLVYIAHPSMPLPPLSSSSYCYSPPPPPPPAVQNRGLEHAHSCSLVRSFLQLSSTNKFCSPISSYLPLHSSILFSTVAASDCSWQSSRRRRDDDGCKKKKKEVTVVLLGWLGAEQKHLARYAEWYTQRGINAVTFVIPMRDVISFKVGGKVEQQIEDLAQHLTTWLNEEEDMKQKHLFFHTFSNTGWLTYGVVLEMLTQRDDELLNKIKGCVVDSAPVAEADPLVWASGFSAALLKKKSTSCRKVALTDAVEESSGMQEQALIRMLEKFFSLFLQLPNVKRRLSEVVNILSKEQPKCPQLYIYSSADKVIPAKYVESFIDKQRETGRRVVACKLVWSPHVDHFRSFPDIYTSQLNSFIQECLSQWSSSSSSSSSSS